MCVCSSIQWFWLENNPHLVLVCLFVFHMENKKNDLRFYSLSRTTADLCSTSSSSSFRLFPNHCESLFSQSRFFSFFLLYKRAKDRRRVLLISRQKITVKLSYVWFRLPFLSRSDQEMLIILHTRDGKTWIFLDMSAESKSNDEVKSLDHLLDDALTGFNATPVTTTTSTSTTTTTKKETVVSSAETAPPPSDPLQATFEAMCFDDEKFLSGLDSLPNVLSNFPFGFGEATENDAESNNIFNLFSQLGKHADLLQKIKDEDIEKALEKLADQSGTASGASATTATSASATAEEPHVEQLNMFMSSILSKDVMLPACQAVDESYEEWLTKNKESLTEEEFQRITRQHQCVKDICREYEGTSADNQQMQRVLQKFQELQSHGDPPKELLFFPGLPGFGSAGDQNLFDDAFSDADKIGQNEAECSLMWRAEETILSLWCVTSRCQLRFSIFHSTWFFVSFVRFVVTDSRSISSAFVLTVKKRFSLPSSFSFPLQVIGKEDRTMHEVCWSSSKEGHSKSIKNSDACMFCLFPQRERVSMDTLASRSTGRQMPSTFIDNCTTTTSKHADVRIYVHSLKVIVSAITERYHCDIQSTLRHRKWGDA